MNITADKKVGDITVGELKDLIREVILESIDPDYGLELREDIVAALEESFKQKDRGEGISLQEARNRLGLE